MKNLNNLFIGPTKEQYEQIKNAEKRETRFMQWLYKNPNVSEQAALEYYKTLKQGD